MTTVSSTTAAFPATATAALGGRGRRAAARNGAGNGSRRAHAAVRSDGRTAGDGSGVGRGGGSGVVRGGRVEMGSAAPRRVDLMASTRSRKHVVRPVRHILPLHLPTPLRPHQRQDAFTDDARMFYVFSVCFFFFSIGRHQQRRPKKIK